MAYLSSWMVAFVQTPQPFPRNVGVDLGRCDVCVAQHCLNRTKVGAMGQQVCSESVPHGVRRDVSPHPGQFCVVLDSGPEVLTGHGRTSIGQKHGLEHVAAGMEILFHHLSGLVAIWHEPVLSTLSGDNDPSVMPLTSLELYKLRYAEPGCIQQFKHGGIPQPQRSCTVRCLQYSFDFSL